ncbi:unnamed protein product, partial [Ectocarpus fasciculatus]
HRRQRPSPTSPRGSGRTLSLVNGGGSRIASSHSKDEASIRRRSTNSNSDSDSGCWLGWARGARHHTRRPRLSGDLQAGFITSPAAAAPGQQRRGPRTCGRSSSSSSGVSPLRSFGGGRE